MRIKFNDKGEIVLPRLTRNSGFLGPEYFGCCGTGRRPKILHCGYSGRYLVGADLDVYELRSQAIHKPRTRIHRKGRQVMWAFKTRGPAVRKFTELCREVIEWNESERKSYNETRRRARAGDMAATISLGMDY